MIRGASGPLKTTLFCGTRIGYVGLGRASLLGYSTSVDTGIATDTASSSSSYQRPFLKSSLFSDSNRKPVDYFGSLLSLDLNTYPNPLYSMSKEEITALSVTEYTHLLQIRYRRIQETDTFCFHISQIFNEMIIDKPKLAYSLVFGIKDAELRSRIVEALLMIYANDIIKRSILKYMASTGGNAFKKDFLQALYYIIKEQKIPANSKESSETAPVARTTPKKLKKQASGLGTGADSQLSGMIVKYMDTLASIPKINDLAMFLTDQEYYLLFSHIHKSHYGDFFSHLVNINIQPTNRYMLKTLQHNLIYGSRLEKLVLRTGIRNARWHHTQYWVPDADHMRKMTNFYNQKDLSTNAMFSIRREDIIEANLYLNLMVDKFERNCQAFVAGENSGPQKMTSASLEKEVQNIIYVLHNHVTTFKGVKHCVSLLKYMVQNKLEVLFEHLISIFEVLRKQGYYKEALLIVNTMNLDALSKANIARLVDEIILLIKQRYPKQPKVVIGYVNTFFEGGSRALEDLGILSLVYGKDVEPSSIPHANLDSKLSQLPLEVSSTALESVYETILVAQSKETITDCVKNLYSLYIQKLQNPSKSHLNNDRIMTLLIKSLLKTDHNSPDMDMVTNIENYQLSKQIINDFHEKIGSSLPRERQHVYMYDLLIYTSLVVHNDYEFAAKMVKYSQDNKLPFTFNQIFPFIKFHYGRKEFQKAELWYQQLVKSGVKATAGPAKEIFIMARELKWDVSGFAYRKSGTYRNYQKKYEFEKIELDSFSFIGKAETEDEITNDLVGVGSIQAQEESNLEAELSSVLYSINELNAQKVD